MRCSRFAHTLLSLAMVLGTIQIASACSRTGVAAEFGANPFIGQTVPGFESVKEWRTYKFTEEVFDFRAKNFSTLPLSYKIAIARAG